ncbi:Fic family protein [Mesorhizobium sp. B1-1-8]|uniref:Fic family protein n=1 Tax=Mesorhizobium sp. B1-1-8 TaxID=2589976 RepID=UPI0011293887|nr:Fic family protein [Mesorhizobium sp. B1-1-8]UCI10615.1 Fic family protein [Mesorhizobium sp. B1-1-8]
MATPQEKLASALEVLHALQTAGRHVVRTGELARDVRELLIRQRFLQPVIKGWYISTDPDASDGETTAWYASFWDFARAYLSARFGNAWVLGPEQSLLLHAGQWNVPRQLLVWAPTGSGQITKLLHNTSIYDTRHPLLPAGDLTTLDGLNVHTLDAALVAATSGVYTAFPTEMRALLAVQHDPSALLNRLLEGGRTVVAGRLAGAFRNIGRDRHADEIVSAMRAAGHHVRENDRFASRLSDYIPTREQSPYVQRIRLMWAKMRGEIPSSFPAPPSRQDDVDAYLKRVDDLYVADAYHSLSIEGYRVSAELIDRVRSGAWNPENEVYDGQQKDAMAARGYWQSFQAVKDSLRRVLSGENAGEVASQEHSNWHRELFQPSVAAGLVKPGSLAGYRSSPVYIRGSRHVPPNPQAVRDLMPALFDLLAAENEPSVRVVLGHFVFVYIHPYMDGNGRTGRFLMNVMMAAGGYPWTVIPLASRDGYMHSLEHARAEADIKPFARFLGERVGKKAPEAL